MTFASALQRRQHGSAQVASWFSLLGLLALLSAGNLSTCHGAAPILSAAPSPTAPPTAPAFAMNVAASLSGSVVAEGSPTGDITFTITRTAPLQIFWGFTLTWIFADSDNGTDGFVPGQLQALGGQLQGFLAVDTSAEGSILYESTYGPILLDYESGGVVSIVLTGSSFGNRTGNLSFTTSFRWASTQGNGIIDQPLVSTQPISFQVVPPPLSFTITSPQSSAGTLKSGNFVKLSIKVTNQGTSPIGLSGLNLTWNGAGAFSPNPNLQEALFTFPSNGVGNPVYVVGSAGPSMDYQWSDLAAVPANGFANIVVTGLIGSSVPQPLNLTVAITAPGFATTMQTKSFQTTDSPSIQPAP